MKRLEQYGGEGYGYSKEVGNYEVRTESLTKKFNRLSKAFRYFKNLDEQKFIWNLDTCELLDGYIWVDVK